MSVRILIDGQELDLGEEVIKRTYQNNLLQEPGSVDASYSNVFQVPASKHNEEILEHSSQLNNQTELPYQVLDAQLFCEGSEEIPYARCEIQKYRNKYYDLQIYSGAVGFFDAVGEKELSELDFSEFTHTWTFDNIKQYADNNSTFVYDLYDRGKGVDITAVNAFELLPSIYARAIWDKIFEQAGFTYLMTESGFFDKLKIPSTKKPELPEKFRKARNMNLAIPQGLANQSVRSEFSRNRITKLVPYSYDATTPYFSPAAGNYNKTVYEYVADRYYYINARARVHLRLVLAQGRVAGRLRIFKNDDEIAYVDQKGTFQVGGSIGGQYFPLDLNAEASNIFLEPGDRVYCTIEVEAETLVHYWGYDRLFRGENQTEADYFSIEVLTEFGEGSSVELAEWLPKMKQRDFIIAMVNIFGWGFYPEPYTNIIRINTLNQIRANISHAVDWSGKIDVNHDAELLYRIPGYAQVNHILWKPDETVTAGYADGVINVPDKTLELTKDIIRMSFAASEMQDGFLLLPMYNLRESTGQTQTYELRNIQPRLVIESDTGQEVTLVQRLPNGTISKSETVTLKTSYFVDNTKLYDLDWNSLIRQHYSVLLDMLNRTKMLRVMAQLDANDINNLDFTVPVYLKQYNEYFYLERVRDYVNSATLCEVELIRL